MTKRTKTAITAALALLLALSMAACALPSPVPVDDGAPTVAQDFVPSQTTTEETNSAFAVDTVDMAGNAVQLAAFPERIVVLDPGDCEILFAIGAGPSVVGRSLACDYPAEVTLLPYATANGKNDPDVLLLREPQLVIMGAEDAADKDLVDTLTANGVPIAVTNVTDVNNLYGAIALLGAVSNHVTEANALVSEIVTAVGTMQTKISEHSDTVYFELTPLKEGATTPGGRTIFSSLIALMGYHNEFEDQEGIISVTQDQVVGRSPDIILTAEKDASPDETAVTPDPSATPDPEANALRGKAEILARTEWATVDAVKNGKVYYFDPALITRGGPRIIDGLNALYTLLYQNTQPEFKQAY